MLIDFNQVKHAYLICGYTDLRKGIDGLAALVAHEYHWMMLYVFQNTPNIESGLLFYTSTKIKIRLILSMVNNGLLQAY